MLMFCCCFLNFSCCTRESMGRWVDVVFEGGRVGFSVRSNCVLYRFTCESELRKIYSITTTNVSAN